MPDLEKSLTSAYFIDSDHPEVKKLAQKIVAGKSLPRDKAQSLYLYVRDHFRYDPFHIVFNKENFTASSLIKYDSGMCIHKAIVLAALARAVGIPSQLGFCDVKNHLSTPKMSQVFKSDTYNFHGYVLLYLGGEWLKATPAFNKELCEKLGVDPLEFDGLSDSIFQECDRGQKKFMEYLKDYGAFNDLPFDLMVKTLVESYPHLFSEGKLNI